MAKTLKWPEDSWAPMLLSALKGKAQIACTNLSLEDVQVYDKLKTAIYLAYEMVPEHYRQNFRNVRKTDHETFVDFVRKQERLFKCWLLAEKAETKRDGETLVLMEAFKNTLDKPLKTHLTDLKTRDLMETARMADEYALSHKTSGAGNRDNETRHNPSAKAYLLKVMGTHNDFRRDASQRVHNT